MPLRRFIPFLLAVPAVAFLWAVAPALSTTPYRPAAVDFEQRVPPVQKLRDATARTAEHGAAHGHYGAHGPVLFRSRPITAPHRFDLVGIAGATHAYEYRARAAGGGWSRWMEADNGDPVYAGGSDEVQVRSRNRPIRGTLHYVNVAGDTTTAGGLLNGLRSAVNSAVVTLAGTAVPDASAAAREPDFITRGEWGANRRQGGCKPRDKPDMGRVKAGVIHHTVSSNDYSEAEVPGIVLGICRFHRNGNGWDDIGYNALVDRFGNVYQGRAGGMSRPVIGAHAEGVNTQTTGVAAIGDFTRKRPSRKLQRGLIRYLAWKLEISGVPAEGSTHLKSTGGPSQKTPKGERMRVKTIFNHGTTNYTACAGARLNKLIPKIRRKVANRIG
ncbi:MAG: N-acetylmuramoyl-L-alanine amidase [Solirubrobacterales bacterium]|nr:N-acetylmuramoyl-L-alanine amidase [Solirubrobacterales bacterium]